MPAEFIVSGEKESGPYIYRHEHTQALLEFVSHLGEHCPHHGPHKCLIACKSLLETVGTTGCCEFISHVFRPWVGCVKVYQDMSQIGRENHAGSSLSFLLICSIRIA